MTAAAGFPTCVACADRIGAYEPVCLQRPDGTTAAGGLARVREDPSYDAPGARLFHRACFAAGQPTSP